MESAPTISVTFLQKAADKLCPPQKFNFYFDMRTQNLSAEQ